MSYSNYEKCWECGSVSVVDIRSEQHKLHLCRKCYEKTPEYEESIRRFKERNFPKED